MLSKFGETIFASCCQRMESKLASLPLSRRLTSPNRSVGLQIIFVQSTTASISALSFSSILGLFSSLIHYRPPEAWLVHFTRHGHAPAAQVRGTGRGMSTCLPLPRVQKKTNTWSKDTLSEQIATELPSINNSQHFSTRRNVAIF